MENQIIYYLNVTLEEKNLKHQFYFDSADVIDIVEGVNTLYSDKTTKRFNKSSFEQEKRVVQALAYAALLKGAYPICLLPTHQAELISKVKAIETDNSVLSQDLLYKLWYEDLAILKEELKGNQEVKIDFGNKFIETWVENGKGESLFKAIYMSDKLSWMARLNQFMKPSNGICRFTNYTIQDVEILDSEWNLFRLLIASIRSIPNRSLRTENNYRDALALLYLARKVKMYNTKLTDIIPIFFDSQNFVNHILPEIINNHFCIENSKSTKYCVLMPALYFKIYALLRIDPSFSNEDAKYRGFLESQKVVIKSIQLLGQSNNTLYSSEKLIENKEEIEERITKYLEYDFFRTILLDTWINNSELADLLSNNLSKNPIQNASHWVKVREEVVKVLETISDELGDFIYWTSKTYYNLNDNVEKFNESFNKLKTSSNKLDVFYHFSLFRFNIPSIPKLEISNLFSDVGLVSSSSNIRNTAFINLWNLHFEVARNKHYHDDESKLFILFSSFWILNMHDFISQINVNIVNLHHSLLMLKGACIYRALREKNVNDDNRKNLNQIYGKIIDILTKRRVKCSRDNNIQYGEISLALSYLWFHYWLIEGGKLYLENYKGYKFIQKGKNEIAIEYAKDAYSFFEEFLFNSISHKLYALNLLVYFVIDSGSDESFSSIEDFRSKFLSLKSSSDSWHFRFDDTISRNFHRISLLVLTKERKLHYSNLALTNLNNCVTKLNNLDNQDISELRNYILVLENYIGEIESRHQIK